MWFIFVFAALALLIAGSIYLRRRLGGALAAVGVSARAIRWVNRAMLWLLFGFPVMVIGAVVVALIMGWESIPMFDGKLGAALLILPWTWAALVVLQVLPWVLVFDLIYLVVRRRSPTRAAWGRTAGVLAVFAVFAIYTPVRIWLEHGEVRIRHYEVAAAVPTGAPPFRIGFIADVQQDAITDGEVAAAAYRRLSAERPDVIISGGDWINMGPDHIEAAAAAGGALTSRLGTYSVRGDHEHFAYVDQTRSAREVEAALAGHGIHMLNNEVRWFEHAGKRIGVLFLNYNYIFRTAPTEIERLVGLLDGADYAIVVSHQFDAKVAALVKDRVDLVLAAHTHGGQVNPVIGVRHLNIARLETRYVSGRYALGRTTVIVTAGVGTSIVPVRYASPGSMEVIDLQL